VRDARLENASYARLSGYARCVAPGAVLIAHKAVAKIWRRRRAIVRVELVVTEKGTVRELELSVSAVLGY
jgi:hypothetical protein